MHPTCARATRHARRCGRLAHAACCCRSCERGASPICMRAAHGRTSGRCGGLLGSELPPGSRLPACWANMALWKSPFTYLERCRRRYGSRFTIRVTSRPPLVFLSDLDDIKAMLTAPADVLHPGRGRGHDRAARRRGVVHAPRGGRASQRPQGDPPAVPRQGGAAARRAGGRSRTTRGRLVAAGHPLCAASASARVDARDRPADDLRRFGTSRRRSPLCAARPSAGDAVGDRQPGLPGAPAASWSRAANLEALPARSSGGRSS